MGSASVVVCKSVTQFLCSCANVVDGVHRANMDLDRGNANRKLLDDLVNEGGKKKGTKQMIVRDSSVPEEFDENLATLVSIFSDGWNQCDHDPKIDPSLQCLVTLLKEPTWCT